MRCARKACGKSPATYFNDSTREWYCEGCALAINEAADVNLCEKLPAERHPFVVHIASKGMTVVQASSLEEAERWAFKSWGEYNVESVDEATEEDVKHVRSMGGKVHDARYRP